jgi:hypothetical protein
VDLDPRIVSMLSGIVLVLIGIMIPSEIDLANQMKDELKVLYEERNLCGDNTNCQTVGKTAIRNLETSLNSIEFTNNMSGMFFWLGLLTSGGSVFALIKSQ